MKNIFGLVLLFLVSTTSWSQNELSLADAVSQQYRKFYPEHIVGFKWIPGTNMYSNIEGYMTVDIHDSKGVGLEKISIQALNDACGTTFPYIANVDWINSEEFYLFDGKSYFKYNWKTKKGKRIAKANFDFENEQIQIETGNVAHTHENNLFVTNETATINVTDFDDPNIVSGQAIARSEFGITNGIFWSPKGNKLAFYQKDESNVGDYPLLDISQTPGKLISIKYPMAGQGSEKAKVGVFDVASKKVLYLEFKGGKEHYYTNVSWTPDEKKILVAELNREQNHMHLNVYDAQTGKFLETLFEEKHEKYVEPEHPAFFLPENASKFVWVTEKDGFNNLYLFDMQSKKETQLTKNRWVVKEVLEVTSKGAYFTGTGEDPKATHLFYVDFNGKQTQLTSQSGTHSVVLNLEKGLIFDQFSDINTPNVAQIINTKGKVMKELVRAKNPFETFKITMGKAEYGWIKAKDETSLAYRLIKPSNFDESKKYPVLVYVYGGPHAQLITDSWLGGASLWMYWMAEQGYLVFTVDGRGSANRGRDFENVIHRNLGKHEIEDQMSGVKFLKSLPYVDDSRMAVHGWSFGGYMTISMMLKKAGVFNVGVAGGPVTDWAYYEVMYGERYMDMPEENPEGYEETALRNHVDKLEGKLMLIHGTADNVVVMQHSLDLIKNFIDKGKQVDFFPYPMHEHNVYGKDRIHLMTKVLEYIINNNK
ncbi:MAG: DPP IV N-terminal domain-containing protein [Crocinitomicaceae bacterium]|nr:DPP IV N-terminal domain-containing protein [Crocinitomicaceae bacterium]